MKEKSRTYNSITNSIWGILSAIITIVLNFLVRICIVRSLGEEINGLHNLFQNTINVMALMETGVSSAMIIHLYEPVNNKDYDLIKKLVAYYRKIYFYIAFLFLIIGILLDILLLDRIVSTTIDMKAVHIYFLFFALSFFANYLAYYKRSILYAEQNNRVSIIATTISQVIFRGLAIIISILTHEYFYFLLFLIGEKICGNIICNIYVNKKHPYLKKIKKIELEKEKKKSLFSTIKPLFINQTSITIQNSANSILISALLGNISIVGYYGNYQLIINTIQLLFSQMGSAFTSSFGNLATEKNKSKMYYIYKKCCFFMNICTIIFCVLFAICVQDFIEMIFGINFVLDYSCVIVLILSMLIYLINLPIISVQNAMGLHDKDAKIMVIQAFVAIVCGYLMGIKFGMEGIILGLTIPTIIFTLVYKGIVISKEAFDIEAYKYLYHICCELIKDVFIIALVIIICNTLPTLNSLILRLIFKGIVAVVIACIFIAIIFSKNEFFQETMSVVKKFIKIIFRRK